MCKLVVEPLSGEYDYFTYLETNGHGGTDIALHLKYDIHNGHNNLDNIILDYLLF